MVECLILITTYNRPELLFDLIRDIKRQFTCKYRLLIYEDKSNRSYQYVKDFMKGMDYSWTTMEKRQGKERFWYINRLMYERVRTEKFDYCIQLLDDMRLIEGFYPRVVDQYKECGAGVLNIVVHEHLHQICTQEKVSKFKVNGHSYWNKQWLDMCFITDRNYFEKIGYTCPEIDRRRFRNRNSSSGVSTALTHRYTKAGGKIVMVENSLLIHTGQQSQMKPHRKGYYSHL